MWKVRRIWLEIDKHITRQYQLCATQSENTSLEASIIYLYKASGSTRRRFSACVTFLEHASDRWLKHCLWAKPFGCVQGLMNTPLARAHILPRQMKLRVTACYNSQTLDSESITWKVYVQGTDKFWGRLSLRFDLSLTAVVARLVCCTGLDRNTSDRWVSISNRFEHFVFESSRALCNHWTTSRLPIFRPMMDGYLDW